MSDNEGPWGKARAEAVAQAQAHAQANPPAVTGRPMGFYLWLGLLAVVAIGFMAAATLMPERLGGGGVWGNALLTFGAVALVSSGLVRLRGVQPLAFARNAALWVAVVGVLALGYAYRTELTAVGQRLQAEIMPDQAVATTAHELVITEDSAGQYSIIGAVNGVPVRFTIDTGASDVVLGPDDAKRIGIDLAALKFDRPYSTANGVGYGANYTVQTLKAGDVQFSNVPVSINGKPLGGSLLGMSFLKRLDSYAVKNGQMTLRWRG